MEGVGNQVETDVDTLVLLVKQKKKISIEQAAKALHLPVATIQTWVDFLLEEGVLGIEYKFVTPYLYFNRDVTQNPTILNESVGQELEDKSVFFEKGIDRGLSLEQINKLWKSYLDTNLSVIRLHFEKKAAAKNFSEVQMKKLWDQYYNYLVKEEK